LPKGELVTNEKTYTERDLILAKREGFCASAGYYGGPRVLNTAEKEAPKIYPLPKATRPRVVVDPHFPDVQWRCSGESMLEEYTARCGWRSLAAASHELVVTNPRIRLWADLLANPTEEVDGE
jgi:hypothetical protein